MITANIDRTSKVYKGDSDNEYNFPIKRKLFQKERKQKRRSIDLLNI